MTAKEIKDRIETHQSAITDMQRDKSLELESLGKLIYEAVESGTGEAGFNSFDSSIFERIDMKDFGNRINNIRSFSIEIQKMEQEESELTKIRFCPKCENLLEEDDLFCPVCGERIVKEEITGDNKSCPQCGNKRKEGAAFCAHCGFRFEEISDIPEMPTIQLRYCEKCGEELEPDAMFCFRCGHKQID